MKSTIGAIALIGGVIATAAAIALAGTAAFAESTADEQRPRLANLRGQDKAVTASQTVSPPVTITAPDEPRSAPRTGAWAGNHGAGRVEPPVGN